MTTNLHLVKPLKRYLRQTWLYPAKVWIERHRPSGVRQHQKLLTFYSQFLHPGDLCFDVGANVGNRTEIFVELGAKVICLEPQENCWKRLYQRFGDTKTVTIVETAIGDYEGFAELSICEDANTISTLSSKWKTSGRFSDSFEWTKTQSVPITTLDNLIERYGCPKFCKIDVEGFEVFVLRGLTQPIPFLSFEFNVELLHEVEACIQHLQTITQVEFNYSISESMELVFPSWVSANHLIDSLNHTKDKLLWGDIYAKLI
ncbi:MAG: FkbM family methyltransferase [Myxacorys chilensis ATA2-1-KO14]|jgi:FkbM family methyltransferase|nr:FkbM family methyltransferase [Myxacorys chilensis ATA2-1-KO14]